MSAIEALSARGRWALIRDLPDEVVRQMTEGEIGKILASYEQEIVELKPSGDFPVGTSVNSMTRLVRCCGEEYQKRLGAILSTFDP